jgi:putative ABC transport system ATP-binding protein
MIEIQKLSKSFSSGKVTVLREVDLKIEKGEFVCVVGPSGSGKSTLLLAMAGLIPPDSGDITIDGKIINALSSRQAADFRNMKIGFVFQMFHLVPYLNAIENVMLPLYITGMKKKMQKERAESVLKQVKLSDRMTNKPSELSAGEQQRVAIARAIANQPDIVFADEPTGNLDRQTGEGILSLLKELDKTIVMVTHDDKAAAIAERVLTLDDGVLQEATS